MSKDDVNQQQLLISFNILLNDLTMVRHSTHPYDMQGYDL